MIFNKKIILLFFGIATLLMVSHISIDAFFFGYSIFDTHLYFHLFHFFGLIIAGLIFSYYYQNQNNRIQQNINELNRFKALSENAPDMIIIHDDTGVIKYANKFAREKLDINQENFSRYSIHDFIFNYSDVLYKHRKSNSNENETKENFFETDLNFPNHNTLRYEFISGNIINSDEENTFLIGRDISERFNHENEIEHLNSLLRAVSNINKYVTTIKNPDKLIKRITDELSKEKRYSTSWIILFDENEKIINYAESGIGETFKEFIDYVDKKGLTNHIKNAIKCNSLNFAMKNNDECLECPLYEYETVGRTLIHSISHNDIVFGVISVTIPEHINVSDKEYKAFEEISGDIGLALYLKQIEKERSEITERYKLQFEEAMDAIILADAETGYVVDCNNQAEVLFNCPKEYLIGKHQTELHPKDGYDYSEDFIKHQNENAGKSINSKIITKDEKIKDVAVKASIINLSGKLFLQGIFRDVTEENILKNELSNIFNLSMDMIATARISDATFTKINPAFTKILGYSEEELLSQSFIEFIHPDDKLKTINLINEKLKKGKKVINFENRYVTKGGNIVWLDWLANSVVDTDTLYSVAHNITDRKERERQLLLKNSIIEQEKKYNESLLSALPDLLFVLNKEGFFINYHSNTKELFYRSPHEFMNQKIEEVLPENIATETKYRINQVLKTKRIEIYNYQLEIDERIEFFESRMVPVDDNHILSIVRNITELKTYQTELIKAKEQAEESDKLKSAFLANMSHELRTPINGVLGFAQVIMQGSETEEEYKEFGKIIYSSADHLLHLINDIIDISKLETGQMSIYRNDFNLNNMMDDIYILFKNLIKTQNKDVVLELHKEQEEPLIINSDDTRIMQILNNLLSNALKFTTKGKIKFGYNIQKNEQILFYVKDTGLGIPHKYHNVIFQRFRQVDRKDKEKYGGAGLGLAISKACTELLGGDIWFNSEINKGTEFYFTVQCNQCVK
jgi:PAS domain S-box-containing protein